MDKHVLKGLRTLIQEWRSNTHIQTYFNVPVMLLWDKDFIKRRSLNYRLYNLLL